MIQRIGVLSFRLASSLASGNSDHLSDLSQVEEEFNVKWNVHKRTPFPPRF